MSTKQPYAPPPASDEVYTELDERYDDLPSDRELDFNDRPRSLDDEFEGDDGEFDDLEDDLFDDDEDVVFIEDDGEY